MSLAPLDHSGPWTFAELESLPDDGQRYEVVDGALLVSPAPTHWHQAVARRLFLQLHEQCPADWEVTYEVSFQVGTDGRVPDLAVVRAGIPVRPRAVAYQPGDFGLLVEVVSPTSTGMDRVLKPVEYARAGVPFYWLVETEPTVEVVAFQLVEGAYVERARLGSGTGVLPGPFGPCIDVEALAAST